MSINSIGQIHITVTNLEEAIEFYRDVLGLPLLFAIPEQSMAFFDVDGVRLYLGKAEDPSFESHPLLYLTVDDIQDEYLRLVGAGVAMLGEPHIVHRDGDTELWMAFFRSPDGNPLALMASVVS